MRKKNGNLTREDAGIVLAAIFFFGLPAFSCITNEKRKVRGQRVKKKTLQDDGKICREAFALYPHYAMEYI
jgi:hypothetical protein